MPKDLDQLIKNLNQKEEDIKKLGKLGAQQKALKEYKSYHLMHGAIMIIIAISCLIFNLDRLTGIYFLIGAIFYGLYVPLFTNPETSSYLNTFMEIVYHDFFVIMMFASLLFSINFNDVKNKLFNKNQSSTISINYILQKNNIS